MKFSVDTGCKVCNYNLVELEDVMNEENWDV
ncbi:hypothetical protein [Escherichia phage ECP2303]